MTFNFKGKVAIVTGGGSGIGAAVARQLGAAGAKVVVADLDIKGADEEVARIEKAGGEAASYKIDVGDVKQVEAMVAFAVKTYGGLHLAVNNAGIGGPSAPTADYPLDGWQQVINVNLNSVFYCMKYQIPAMLAAGGGAIVNMASILGSVGFANAPAYVAAKHGMVGLTKTTAIEYAKQGIRVNSVGPGFIDTPFNDPAIAFMGGREEQARIVERMVPLGRQAMPDEVAPLYVYLLSDESAYVTAQALSIDGGVYN